MIYHSCFLLLHVECCGESVNKTVNFFNYVGVLFFLKLFKKLYKISLNKITVKAAFTINSQAVSIYYGVCHIIDID